MANFLADILEASKGDTIHYLTFGGPIKNIRLYEEPGYLQPDPRDNGIDFTKLYTFEEAKPFLDYTYKEDECHNITAWSNNWIYYIYEYAGNTTVCALPRNPKVINL